MSKQYLNDSNREFYDKAVALIKTCTDDFWPLDDGLEEHIDLINLSQNVRTMYSRRGKNRSGDGLESYLDICYVKETESQIRNLVESVLQSTFAGKHNCKFEFQYKSPRVQIPNEKAPECLKYIEDANYWNIHHIRFELKGGFQDDHTLFWTILSGSLSKL